MPGTLPRSALMVDREIIVCRDLVDLNEKGATLFVDLATRAIAASGCFSVGLSGGSTPESLYTVLGSADYRERVAWKQVHWFWGDERCVPPDHPQSNYRMVREALLARVDRIPAENVHRMAGEKAPQVAAEQYEQELRTFFKIGSGALPRFDLIFLGMGEDGHTASLFPGSKLLDDNKHLVATEYVDKLAAHRLTLTLPVLNQSAQVIFLVAGKSKAPIVAEVLGATARSPSLPAARIRPVNGRLTWLVTEEALGRREPR